MDITGRGTGKITVEGSGAAGARSTQGIASLKGLQRSDRRTSAALAQSAGHMIQRRIEVARLHSAAHRQLAYRRRRAPATPSR